MPFDSDRYEVKQVFYTSTDGTRIPMFIAGRKGLAMDGKAPVLMTGYGGFLISETPGFNLKYAWWMSQGGFFALPNLRGGGEYGEDWHKAGMFEHKQNVFDDWFAAAEFLIANHYTTTPRLAITGGSNGGLLMGASMTQRPDLFGAIHCGYPLLDMSRYQNFLVGRWWTTEYGSAEKPEQAAYILKYSPYQDAKAPDLAYSTCIAGQRDLPPQEKATLETRDSNRQEVLFENERLRLSCVVKYRSPASIRMELGLIEGDAEKMQEERLGDVSELLGHSGSEDHVTCFVIISAL